MAESLLGAGEGPGELTVELGRTLVLRALTFGCYGAYELGNAIWDGYKEDGVIGALNAVNPMYHILRTGTDTVLAAERGDYRAAGAAGTKATLLTLGAAVGLGEGLAAVSGRAVRETGIELAGNGGQVLRHYKSETGFQWIMKSGMIRAPTSGPFIGRVFATPLAADAAQVET
ncbi:hypothetical protein WME89_52390 [Sorangium sp. So ce321]|uniref:hypothetical protein n=1 Tax=Sorangium sp. So ce321 TaxID=3133300 RepID=UPI003F5DC8BF